MLTEYWTEELGPKDALTQKEDTLQAALMILFFITLLPDFVSMCR